MAITGHTTTSMFRRYDTVTDEDRNKAAKLMENMIKVQRICSAKKKPLDKSG